MRVQLLPIIFDEPRMRIGIEGREPRQVAPRCVSHPGIASIGEELLIEASILGFLCCLPHHHPVVYPEADPLVDLPSLRLARPQVEGSTTSFPEMGHESTHDRVGDPKPPVGGMGEDECTGTDLALPIPGLVPSGSNGFSIEPRDDEIDAPDSRKLVTGDRTV